MSRPPRLAERLLAAALRDRDRSELVLGDLHEEFLQVAARRGAAAATRWYWLHAARLAVRLRIARLTRRGPAVPRWSPGEVQPSRPGLRGLGREVRDAARSVARRPATSAVIVATLAVALAANAAIYNLADALVFRPFRFAGVERLVLITSARAQDVFANRTSVAPADFVDWTRELTTVESLGAAQWWDPNLAAVDVPEQVPGVRVTPAFLRNLGIPALLGRIFDAEDATPAAARRVVLGHAVWTRRFGADAAIVGRTVRLDGEPYEVIGVMPPSVAVPYGAEVWAPLALDADGWRDRGRGSLLVTGRLRAGRTLGEAAAEVAAVVERQRAAFPATNARREVAVMSFAAGLSDESAGPLVLLWEAAALLLALVACANVANLLLAGATERSQEFAVRLALGASRARLGLQVLLEGAWLAVAGGAAAVPLAAAAIVLTFHSLPPPVRRFVPGHQFLRLDASLVALLLGFALACGVVFSVLPALQAMRSGAAVTLRAGARTVATARPWLRSGLAAAQVAITLALLTGSTLVLQAVDDALNGALGFDRREVLTATLTLPPRAYATPEQRRQFVAAVSERMAARPAVQVVSVTSNLPYAEAGRRRAVLPEGAPPTAGEVRPAGERLITTGYFAALRIARVAGRGLEDGDTAGAPLVAVVSQGLAAAFWPGQDPIGQRFRQAADGPWITVVGVVSDVRHDWLFNSRDWSVYRPYAQDPSPTLSFVVRTQGDPADLAGDLRRAVGAVDADQPLLAVRTMQAVMDDRSGGIRYLSRALAAMSVIALVLAVTGIYALVSFLTARRTREIGVRMALGATRGDVVRLATRQAAGLAAVGLVAGMALALGMMRAMETALFGLIAMSPWTLAGVTAGLAAAVLLAGYLPARRAASLDPTTALRAE